MTQGGKRVAVFALAVIAAASATLALTSFSTRAGWETASYVAQTASAVLSGLALVGVGYSLLLQARETRIAREQAGRAAHVELMKMAIENPDVLASMGGFETQDLSVRRAELFANLRVSQWQMRWEIGTLSEAALRSSARDLFRAPSGLRFWAGARADRADGEMGKRIARFHQIVDSEYETACAKS